MKNKYLACMMAFLGIGLADLVYLNSKIIPALWPSNRVVADQSSERSAQSMTVSQGPKMESKAEPRVPASRDLILDENNTMPASETESLNQNTTIVRSNMDQDMDRSQKEAVVPPTGLPVAERAEEPQGKKKSALEQKMPGRPSLMEKIVVHFDLGEYQLSSKQYRKLLSQLEGIHFTEKIRVSVDGHADYTGSGKFDNDLLSRRRADFVADLLRQKGVLENRITTKGYGDSQPVDKNDTPEAFAENRRAEIKIYRDEP